MKCSECGKQMTPLGGWQLQAGTSASGLSPENGRYTPAVLMQVHLCTGCGRLSFSLNEKDKNDVMRRIFDVQDCWRK